MSLSPCGDVEAALAPPDAPWEMLNLGPWKLTLPIGSKGKPTEIRQPTLNTWRDPDYFYVNGTNDGVVFRCPGTGVTTSNSGNPRTELREMTADGSDEADWSPASGTHTLTIVQRIIAAPHPVVVGQVHGGDDDVCVFRYQGGILYATDDDDPTADSFGPLALNTPFTVQFVASGGQINMTLNGGAPIVRSYSKGGCYFKAGCYNQSHGDAGTAEVVIHDLDLAHS
jgi:hypothetical protein